MRESFTYGSVGRALRKQCLYPERRIGKSAALLCQPLNRWLDLTIINEMDNRAIIDVSKLDKPQDLFENYDDGFKEFPSHIVTLYKNWSEILNLIEIQEEGSQKISMSRKRIEVLNKASIVFLVAGWEAFIEDLAENAFDHLMKNAETPIVFPKKVLSLSAKELHESMDRTKVWTLSGAGWKDVLKAHRKKIINQYIGRLNTPRPKQVDNLFTDIIGFKNLSSLWKWRRMPNKNVIKKLEDLITLRGEIAHRLSLRKKIRKNDIVDYARFISRISVISSNNIEVFVTRRTKKNAWKLLRIGETWG
jgi:hypothetical protein